MATKTKTKFKLEPIEQKQPAEEGIVITGMKADVKAVIKPRSNVKVTKAVPSKSMQKRLSVQKTGKLPEQVLDPKPAVKAGKKKKKK